MPLNPHLAFNQNHSMWEEGVTITQPPNSHVKCLNFKFSTHVEDFKLNLLLKRERNKWLRNGKFFPLKMQVYQLQADFIFLENLKATMLP